MSMSLRLIVPQCTRTHHAIPPSRLCVPVIHHCRLLSRWVSVPYGGENRRIPEPVGDGSQSVLWIDHCHWSRYADWHKGGAYLGVLFVHPRPCRRCKIAFYKMQNKGLGNEHVGLMLAFYLSNIKKAMKTSMLATVVACLIILV